MTGLACLAMMALSFALGGLLLRLGGFHPTWRPLWMGWPLLLGTGFAVSATCTAFAILLGLGEWAWMIEAALLLALLVMVRRGRTGALDADKTPTPGFRKWQWLLLALLVLADAWGSLQFHADMPMGKWDALMFWNLHARFLSEGVLYWRWPPIAETPWWCHHDYPLLLPLLIARLWRVTGSIDWIGFAVNSLHAWGCVALLGWSLLRRAGPLPSWMGMAALLASPYFFVMTSFQDADVVLAFYMLSAMVWLAEWEAGGPVNALAISGGMALLAAWTKNEGQLFAAIFLLATSWSLWRHRRPGMSRLWLVALPLLLALSWFKYEVKALGDLDSAWPDIFARLGDARRLAWIAGQMTGALPAAAGGLMSLPLLLLFGWLFRMHRRPELDMVTRIGLLSLLGMVAGFFGVYAITPHDLPWHLKTSIYRLAMQLWPVAIWLVLVHLPAADPQETGLALTETQGLPSS